MGVRPGPDASALTLELPDSVQRTIRPPNVSVQVAAASKSSAASIQRAPRRSLLREARSTHEGGVCLPRRLCATTPSLAYAHVGRVRVLDLEGVEGEGDVADLLAVVVVVVVLV